MKKVNMKKIIYGLLLLCAACKKQPVTPVSIEPGWQQLLNDSDRAVMDTLHPVVSHQHGNNFWMYQLPKGFVLVEMDSLGHFIKGRIVSLYRTDNNPARFNGTIQVQSLQRALIAQRQLRDGRVVRKPAPNESLADPYDELPEVIVVAYRSSGGGLSYSDYMSFQNLIDGSGGNGGSSGNNGLSGNGHSVYSPVGSAESGGSSVGGGMGAGPTGDAPSGDLDLQYENSYNNPAIDMDAWMNCFSTIPDAGAHCSVTLYCDIAVDNDPSQLLDIYTGATGHVFMGLTKENGGQSITQIIGFTTVNAWNVFGTTETVPAKTVSNAGHGYDASYTIPMDVSGLNAVINQAKFYSASMAYDILHFNCIQYAIGSINTAMGVNPIVIPPRYSPTSGAPINTPSNLYYVLESMKAAGGSEASRIQFGFGMKAGSSHGPCN